MNEMLNMQYEDLTGQNLGEKGGNSVLNGLRYCDENLSWLAFSPLRVTLCGKFKSIVQT